jgi:hypothetical protein
MTVSSDRDRLERQLNYMSRSEQREATSSLVSFTRWLQAIKALADLVPYAITLYQWAKKRFNF